VDGEAKPAVDRKALFDRKYKNGDGKLSQEEFMANQPDPDAAKSRFEKWDGDKDGFLTREEFINPGGKPK
jgi:iduronate 2-sulfatase